MKPKDIMINNMAVIRTTIMATNKVDTQMRGMATLEVLITQAEIIKITQDNLDNRVNKTAAIGTVTMATNREDTQIRDIAILEVMTIRAEIIKIMRDKDNRVNKTVAIGTVTMAINREDTQIRDMAILEVMVTQAEIIRITPKKDKVTDYVKKDTHICSAAILEIVVTKVRTTWIPPVIDVVMNYTWICTAYQDQSNRHRRGEKRRRQIWRLRRALIAPALKAKASKTETARMRTVPRRNLGWIESWSCRAERIGKRQRGYIRLRGMTPILNKRAQVNRPRTAQMTRKKMLLNNLRVRRLK